MHPAPEQTIKSYTMDDVMGAILDWHREQLTYRRTFRKYLLVPLSILIRVGEPLTSNEIAKLMPNEFYAKKHTEHFPELRFWKLIKPTETNGKHMRYRHTRLAEDFLNNKVSIPKWIFTYNNKGEITVMDTPEDKLAPLVYVDDLWPEEYGDRFKHVEEAIEAPQLALIS